MGNPRAAGRFYLGVIGLAIVLALIDSLLHGSFTPLVWTSAALAVLLMVCVVVSLFFAVVFSPLLWLLSRLSGRGRDEPKRAAKKP